MKLSYSDFFAKVVELLRALTESGILEPKPGITHDFIETIDAEEDWQMLPPPLAEWLTYCNGIFGMSFGDLYGYGEGIDYDELTSHWKQRHWTPIAGDGCGSYYLMIKHETREGTLYPVVFADHEDSVIEENGENQLCNRISYLVASDLPHFLEAIFRHQEHYEQCRNRDDDEYLDFWWPFDKTKVRQFDPNIEKIGIITPWAANARSIWKAAELLLQNGNREEARQSFLRAAEEARKPNRTY